MTLKLVISRTWNETPEIRCFELSPTDGSALPAFEPGSHIAVKLPGGLVRQYSIWNSPSDASRYLLGVKLERESRGGSIAMHKLADGDEIHIELPKNNFPLANPPGKSILLAGGVGITPLLSMAQSLEERGLQYHLHLFARSEEMTPFRDIVRNKLNATIHLGLVPPQLDCVVDSIISNQDADTHVYICGPAPFMTLCKSQAETASFAERNIHLEYFAAPADSVNLGGGEFEVVLARSAKTIVVHENQTILEAMNEVGIEILTSCEQGVCGTCVTSVLEGEPDHRDLYFSATERTSGKVITPCVSRCKGKRLVLDL